MPSTITGSIGVFGVIPNVEKLLKDYELNVETVGTHKHSGMCSMYTKMDSREIDVIQQSVETVYGRFISHVAEGRNMTTAEVDSIGQGRVWSGASALKIGLVDTLGSLNDALTIAAELADVSEYSTTDLPELQDDSMSMLLNLLSMKVFTPQSQMHEELTPLLNEYKRIKRMEGVQCRMEPFMLEY